MAKGAGLISRLFPQLSGSKKKNNAGGSATASGINFQAAATAIAEVYLARGRALGWLEGLVDDVPVSVLSETGGSGDDIQLRLRDGSSVEVQVSCAARH